MIDIFGARGDNVGYFDLKDYFSWDKSVRTIKVPRHAALYVWVRPLSSSPTKGILPAVERILEPTLRSDYAPVGPYTRVSLQTAHPPLGPAKRNTLQSIDASEQEWISNLALIAQRPLYIGITGNLASRLRTHIRDGSRLRRYMDEAEIEITECALFYYVPEYSNEQEEDDDDREEGIGPESETSQPENVVSVLRLAEALTIRLAQPFFNQSME